MQYKTLGNTGLSSRNLSRHHDVRCDEPSALSENGAIWKAIGSVDQAGSDALIKASIEAGVNFIDTADVYLEGRSETTVASPSRTLKIPRHEVVLATKVYGRTGPGRNEVGASRGHIMDAVEDSLRRLQTDHIDLYQFTATTPSRSSKKPSARSTHSFNRVKSATSASPTGSPGRSPRRSESPSSRTSPASTPRRPTTPSQAVTWSATSFHCSKLRRPACWSGVRSPAACSPANSPGRTRSPRTPAALPSTSRSSTRIASGTSWTPSSPSQRTTMHRPPLWRWPTYWLNPSSRPLLLAPNASISSTKIWHPWNWTLSPEELKKLDDASALPPEYPGWMLPFQGANRLANVPQPTSLVK